LLEPNLERVRVLLRTRRDAMLEALERELGGRARWSRPEGGYFLWLELPEGTDSAELLGRASEAGVTFVPGSDFGGGPSSARLAFSYASPAEIDEGVSRLAGLVPAPAAA
jgi:DNA-binding transcriptional MocR family regulator